MLQNQGVCIVQFIQCDVDDKIFLGQCHVLIHLRKLPQNVAFVRGEGNTHLKGIVEIADFAKIVQELVDPRLIVLDKWVQGDHVGFLGI